MRRKYDFILFENAYQLENHYLDLELLALALKRAGYNVAIADVFKEHILCKNQEIPHITLKRKPYSLFRQQAVYRTTISSFRYTYLRFLCNIYLIYVMFVLKKQTKRIYVGSLTIDTPLLWLFLSPLKIDIYIWGLRSYVLEKWKVKLLSRYGIYSFFLSKICRHYKRIKIVVSNGIIQKEFQQIIKTDKRTLVRPERWLSNEISLPPLSINCKEKVVFLTIGTLRYNKHVELVYDALRICESSNYQYIVAGRCKDDNGYEQMLNERRQGLNNVMRISRFIPTDEYEKLFEEADCIILCDEPEKSCGTNGTMMEALLKCKPLIAPRHEPFISEIEKTGVGVVYDLKDTKSLARCIDKIISDTPSSYRQNIEKYLDNYREKAVIQSIKKQIENNENS